MKPKNKDKAVVIRLADYKEYADIIDEMEGFNGMVVDRLKLRKLYEEGLTFVMFTQWIVDEHEKFNLYRRTPAALNMLTAYTRRELEKARNAPKKPGTRKRR